MSEKYITNLKNQFKDKVIVITGSTQGSGAETAKLFAHRGAKAVTICGRQEAQGKSIKKEIEDIGSKCIYIKADLEDEDDCRRIISGFWLNAKRSMFKSRRSSKQYLQRECYLGGVVEER